MSACFVARSTTRHVRGEKTPWSSRAVVGLRAVLAEHDLHASRPERAASIGPSRSASGCARRRDRHEADVGDRAAVEVA